LKARDLWPLLSWVIAEGKCRYCGNTVSWRYPLTEVVTAAVFLLVYAYYGFTLQALLLCLLVVVLLIMIVADLEHTIIPDEVHVALLPLGLIYHFIIGTDWSMVAGGFAVGLFTGLSLHHGYRWLRKKEGLGYGDVKFFAVAGIWLTLYPFVPFLFFSGLFGIATGLLWRALKLGAYFPLGPALAVALFVCVAFPQSANLFWNMLKTAY